ncbi:MAG: PAS domain S-box protein [Rubrivivax sp.]|nr:PAS domain S-box protein [Rubrivivax sp.]
MSTPPPYPGTKLPPIGDVAAADRAAPARSLAEGLRRAALQTSGAILATQRRAEQALLQARDELATANAWQRAILDSADVAIIATDPQGLILTFNRAAERLLGYRAVDVVGKCTPEILHDAGEVKARAAELSQELGQTIEPGFEVFVAKARQGLVQEREWTYQCRDGSRRPVRLTVTAMFDAERQITGFMGVATDLSEVKRRETRFRDVVEAVPNGIVMVNQRADITLVNEQTELMFGYARAELLGQPVEMLVPERDRAAHASFRDAFFADPQARAMGVGRDLYGRRKDGSEFPIEIGLSPMASAHGAMILSSIVDISARKQGEQALRQARDELESRVQERTAELAQANEKLRGEVAQRRRAESRMQAEQDVLGRIVAGRPLAEILTTLVLNIESQLDGALCSILLLDDDGLRLRHGAAPSLPEAYNQAIDGGAIGPAAGSCGTAAFRGERVVVDDIASDPLWADYKDLALAHGLRACWSTPIQSAGGQVLGTFALYADRPRSPEASELETIDMTAHLASIAIERKQAEQALLRAYMELEGKVARRTAELSVAKDRAESADRLKSSFLATMSHELRTPLNSIIGFTGILLQGLAGPLNDEQGKQLGMVQGSARHLLTLINDVLDISKIEAGQLEVGREPFDLGASLVKVAAIVQPLAEKKQLALNLPAQPGLARALGDAHRVEQILLNLLSNAIKFTESGTVSLRAAAADGGRIRVDIADTGIGIAPQDMAALFEPFRQIDSRLSRQHEGTGLGLAISRRLARLMGGSIEVDSRVHEGSVFSLLLPAAQEGAP